METLRDMLRQFNTERDWEQFHSPKNLAMALMVETAELMEHFQWLTQEQSRHLSSPKKKEIEEEIGDILIYLVNLADKLGIDPVKAAKTKVDTNRKKYPVSKSRGNSLKYNEYSKKNGNRDSISAWMSSPRTHQGHGGTGPHRRRN